MSKKMLAIILSKKISQGIQINERGYFRSISSGRDFQFFSAHFFSKCRMDMRVGAFDRSMSPT